jgi:protein phosphatase
MITLTWGSATDAGRVRLHNEDALLAEAPVFLVADGMGGHAAGDQASALAVAEFAKLAGARITRSDVLATIDGANTAILDGVRADESRAGMGTTLAGLALIADGGQDLWLAFNVGDSRIYRLAGSELERISTDHSQVQALVDAGQITEEQRRGHPLGNVVTRVLGMDPPPVVDCWLLWPVAGERFLLCSDGLTGEIPDEQLRALLGQGAAEETAALLIRSALSAGAQDNVTAVVVDVLGTARSDEGDTSPLATAGDPA